MQPIKNFIQEKLIINKDSKLKQQVYHYHPKKWHVLRKLVKDLIEERGDDADLNDIDTSEITDMSYMFYDSKFNGNISRWDVSNVKNMREMFFNSQFKGDISKWDVSNVENMYRMFTGSGFNGNISNWDVNNVNDMTQIFMHCPLRNNPPKWYKK